MGGSKTKHCPQCVASKSSTELYGTVKPISKCPGTPGEACDKMANNNRSKYCAECSEKNKNIQKRQWIAEERKNNPEFVEKEQKYLNEYCERKGITRGELWADIFVNRAVKNDSENDSDPEGVSVKSCVKIA